MKTLNDFLASEQSVQILTVNELVSVKGGETPPDKPNDPFKSPNGNAYGYWKSR